MGGVEKQTLRTGLKYENRVFSRFLKGLLDHGTKVQNIEKCSFFSSLVPGTKLINILKYYFYVDLILTEFSTLITTTTVLLRSSVATLINVKFT